MEATFERNWAYVTVDDTGYHRCYSADCTLTLELTPGESPEADWDDPQIWDCSDEPVLTLEGFAPATIGGRAAPKAFAHGCEWPRSDERLIATLPVGVAKGPYFGVCHCGGELDHQSQCYDCGLNMLYDDPPLRYRAVVNWQEEGF